MSIQILPPPLATPEELEMVMGRELSDAERPQAELLLDAASARLRALTGQMLTAGGEQEVHDGRWAVLLQLDQVPVIEVLSVEVEGHPLGPESYRLDPQTGSLWRRGGTWSAGRQGITVSYRYGYDPVPADLVLVCCSMVNRALSIPPESDFRSEQFGPYRYDRGPIAGLGAVGLTGAEQETINRYRLRREVIP